MFRKHLTSLGLLAVLAGGCASQAEQAATNDTAAAWRVALPAQIEAASQAIGEVVAPSAVYVGEAHDQLPYHINQLAVIAALHETGVKVAVGLEMIQTPFQDALDDFIAGRIAFGTLLARTEYYTRWQYDARLYEPIFSYARRHELPLVALNAPRELTDRVSAVGFEGLSDAERARLPAVLTPPDPAYRKMLEDTFRQHEELSHTDIERFIQVQMTWDEIMASSGARFLRDHPDHVLVVLAGIGHVEGGHGIPRRLEQAADVRGVIVLSENERDDAPGGADVYLDLVDDTLPAPGRMGVLIRPAIEGAVVDDLADGSPAEQAGVLPEDNIVDIDGRAIGRFADIRLALWDKRPGDGIQLTVLRGDRRLTFSFSLY